MSSIDVNPNKIDAASKIIDSRVKSIKNKMGKATNQVSALSSSWVGKDYIQFKSQWDRVSDTSSTYAKTIKALESYSGYLKYASKKYSKAQTDAINRANSLPR